MKKHETIVIENSFRNVFRFPRAWPLASDSSLSLSVRSLWTHAFPVGIYALQRGRPTFARKGRAFSWCDFYLPLYLTIVRVSLMFFNFVPVCSCLSYFLTYLIIMLAMTFRSSSSATSQRSFNICCSLFSVDTCLFK